MEYISRASRFCEQVNQVGIAQVANSWSNIAFVIFALVIVWQTKRSGRSIASMPIYSYLFAVFIALVGITSFWNHAALSYWGGFADVESMYLLVSFAILLSVGGVIGLGLRSLLGWLVFANIPLAIVAGSRSVITDYVFGLLILMLIGLELYIQRTKRYIAENKYFWLSLLTFLLAFGIWQLDIRGIWCNPTSLIQGHAVWHVLSAIASYFLYCYFLTKTSTIRGEI